jgi:hypothetical protein
MKQYTGSLIIAAAIIAAAFIIRTVPAQRFAMVQRENNRMVLLDTVTGQFWDVSPNRVGAEPRLGTAPLPSLDK